MPNRKITNLKVFEGNRGKRPLPKNEPKPQPKIPDLPKDIDLQSKRTWDRLAPIAERLGLLTEVDGDMFAALCQARTRLMQIWTRLKQIPKEVKKLEKDLKNLTSIANKQTNKHKQTKNGDSDGADPDDRQGKKIGDLQAEIAEIKTERAYWMKEERLYFNSFRTLANDFGFSPRGRVGLVVMGHDTGEGEDLLS